MIGERLKHLRGEQTQEEIAKCLGISRARYSHYENGRSEPDIQTLKKLADFFKVTTDYLIGRIGDPIHYVRSENSVLFDVPPLNSFFKEVENASEEEQEQLWRFWSIIKTKNGLKSSH